VFSERDGAHFGVRVLAGDRELDFGNGHLFRAAVRCRRGGWPETIRDGKPALVW
jgi:hypothetical protein